MISTQTHAAPAASRALPLSAARRVAFAVAVLACLPYLALKVTWIAGAEIGIPAGSSLLDPDHLGTMKAVNALTVAMDSAVVALALMLTRPWGRRLPASLLAGPTWVATGLLAPIVIGFPLQLVAGLATGSDTASTASEPFLEPWVFSVVYGGFIVQALALGTLFVTYAVDRWGALWQGCVGGLAATPTLPALRVSAVGAALVSAIPLAVQLLWASGSVVALGDETAADRDAGQLLVHATHVPLILAAVTGILVVAFRIGSRLPLAVPLVLAWVGSAAMACWGAWSLFASLAAPADGGTVTHGMSAVYALHVIGGVMIAVAGMHALAERSATT